jgi:toxin ParE1/3/4
MPHHRLAPQAELAAEIWLYLARERNPDAADRLVDTLAARFLRLSHHPHIGRDRSADLQPGLRSFPAEPFVILYSVHDSAVHILRVLHGSRDLPALLDID